MSRALWVAVALSLLVPTAVGRAADQPEILTPPPAAEPRSDGAKVFDVRLGHPRLEWNVQADTGRLSVRRAKDETVWGGEMLAEVGYWDAAGAERSQPLNAANGWKLERRPAEHGCRLMGRQETLGFSIPLDFSAAGDALTVSVPAGEVVESGPARLKSLRLLPRFGAAREGDAGYLVIAQQSGAICHFRDKQPGQHWVSVYQSSCQCPMPLFGIVRGNSAVAGIITSGQFDARLGVSVNWGPQHQYAIDPAFTLRSFRDDRCLPEPLTVEYRFLPDSEANWLGVGKWYRQYNFTRRGLRPLRERTAKSPELAYSASALEVRIRLGVKPVPHEVKEQTPETEPPVRVFCDFARVRDILDEFRRQGIARAEVCLVGWNRGGHDGRYPQVLPVEPALGGEAQLRETIRHGQSLGYQIVAHDCYYDAYRISEDWSEAYLRKEHNGQPYQGGVWGGGQSYNVCLDRASELFAKRNLPLTRELGFRGLHYSDVISIIGPRTCYDPQHPQTRRQDAAAATRILALAQQTFGGVQSEGSLDFTATALDRLLYVDCDKWLPLTKCPYVDTRVPLYETVYHGVLLYSLSTDTVNCQPGDDAYLRSIEYGAVPLTYFYGHFLLDASKNWLGKSDYRYDDAAGLKQTVTGLRRVYDDVQRLNHLQMEFLDGHRTLVDQVFETRYSNGQCTVVNYREQPHTLPSGDTVPARGYLLLDPPAAAPAGGPTPAPRSAAEEESPAKSLAAGMDGAWRASWSRFYRPKTNLFYDYLSSYEPGRELAHLPTAAEVARQYPNECGYGTGMEDCMISAGVMLSLIVDRYAVTSDETLRERANAVVRGIHLCATVHGAPGFLARGVCVEDGKSIYANSSRDQYTHAVHGLWLYLHSPLCDPATQRTIAEVLSAIADRMTRNVTPENDYDSLRADGSRDTRGISRMWNVKGHEAARLPMIYAAAWDATNKQEYFDRYRQYLASAVQQSHVVDEWQPTYALLQMQSSLELLNSLEREPALKKQVSEIMALISRRCAARALRADGSATKLDLTMTCSDWRTGEGLSFKGKYRPVWNNVRESGEAALSQLIDQGAAFPAEQQRLLARAITRLDYDRVSSCGIFYLQAAYWKARRCGLMK